MARYINADVLTADFIQQHTANADVFLTIRKILDNVPTADVAEVKHGEWVHSKRGFDLTCDYECSVCHSPDGIKQFYSGRYSFCPACGAKMDGGEE